MRRRVFLLLALTWLGCAHPARTAPPSLAGTWRLKAAERLTLAGVHEADYGRAPQGRLTIDERGRYSLQIYRSERVDFASADKREATEVELRDAVLGASTHFGSLEVDWVRQVLVFHVVDSGFPNWRGQTQERAFSLEGEVLTYRVPARPDGAVPISVWEREPQQ